MASQKKPLLGWVVFGAVSLGAVVILVFYRSSGQLKREGIPTNRPLDAASQPASRTAVGTNGLMGASQSLRDLCGMIKSSTDAKSVRLTLEKMRISLASMPASAAVEAIRQFLDSKEDAATHLGFKIAANGSLDEAPTLRTFFLDELGRLDPAAAAAYSRGLLATRDSPDEWALALRNLANGDASSDGRQMLLQKTAEMLGYEPWQKDPSAGYLEAFDTAVYLGGTNLIPALSTLVRMQDNPAVAHASFLALDRMVIADPAGTLAAIAGSPDLMQGREATRADFFARADPRDPQQRQILENYLLNPGLGAEELSTFAGIFPNANFMISHNLLTQSQPPDRGSLAGLDAGSLNVVQQWQGDSRFANLAPQLQRISSRLQNFVQQEKNH